MKKQKLIKQKNDDAGISGLVRIITKRAGTQEILRTVEYTNRVVSGTNTGRNIIAQRLAGINTYTGNITHGAIGTGTNTPADSDTGLQTETVQVAVATSTVYNNVATFQFFFTDAVLANGTYYEFGTKIDTTQLFNRALFGSPYVKSTNEDTTVEVIFTINNA